MIPAASIGAKVVTVGAFLYGLVFTDGSSWPSVDSWQTLEALCEISAEYDELQLQRVKEDPLTKRMRTTACRMVDLRGAAAHARPAT